MSIWVYCTRCGLSLLDPNECENKKSEAAPRGAENTERGDRESLGKPCGADEDENGHTKR